LASPILRETIKKLKARQALLERQVKGPLEELRQIEEDLQALGAAASGSGGRARRSPRRTSSNGRAPRGANQAPILRAVRNGATTPQEIADKTGIAGATVNRTVSNYLNKQKLLTTGPNGLTLTKSGRDKLADLEGRDRAAG
jgi:DNA-binding NarL/FixJ family response regulator